MYLHWNHYNLCFANLGKSPNTNASFPHLETICRRSMVALKYFCCRVEYFIYLNIPDILIKGSSSPKAAWSNGDNIGCYCCQYNPINIHSHDACHLSSTGRSVDVECGKWKTSWNSKPSYYLAKLPSYTQPDGIAQKHSLLPHSGKQQVIRKAVFCAVTCVWLRIKSNFLFALPV